MCQTHKFAAGAPGEATALQAVNEPLRDLFFDDYWRVGIHEIE
jgi:hypothetical protein